MNTPPRTQLIANRFARALATYERQATVQRLEAERLAEVMGAHFHVLAPRILEVGCGTGLLSRQLMARFAPSELVVNDLCPDMGVCFANVPRTTFWAGDAQTLPWPGAFDAIVSASAVQWFKDLRGFVARCAETLPKGGLLAIASFGPETLREVMALTGRGLDYLAEADFFAAFEGFEPKAREHRFHTLAFPDAPAVLRHLRETGVTATGGGEVWTPARLKAFAQAYAERFPHPQGVSLTYETYLYVGVRR